MNDLIRDRDERTRKRKKFKRKMDEIIGLSYHDKDKNVLSLSMNIAELSDKTIRLLDEGFIDNDGGFVIKKGTIEKFLNGNNQFVRGYERTDEGWEQTDVLNLTEDFVGSVNLGHMDFATFPFIIGEWTKEDLSIEDIGNDRKGLNVALRLDEDSIFIRELKRQPYDIGVSAEFWYHVNEEDTKTLSEMLGVYTPVIDEIFIFAYGLVGECGNVNSSGLELKGDFNMKDIEKLNEIELEVETTQAELTDEPMEESAENAEESRELSEESAEEESTESEEAEDNAPEEAEEAEADDIEADGEEADSEDDEEDGEETEGEEVYQNVEAYIANLEGKVSELTSENTELKKKIRRLNKKLKNEYEKKETFVSKFSNVVSAMGDEETETPKQEKSSDYITGDGIGV